jgi:aryl-alcohol dehydrogenase-like predicted oxidoreductase
VVNAAPFLYGLLAGDDPIEVAKICSVDSDELARARRIWEWCGEKDIHAGVFAMQFSLRNLAVSSTLAGPRNMMELKQNFSFAKSRVGEAIFREFDDFIGTLGPPPPGGETM